ncbi:PIG-P-domain-containing protein, partial [Trichodelitschia bisporula]
SSDAESAAPSTTAGGLSTTAATLAAARAAHALPRARPAVPTYEYYGFALYVASSFAFGMYVLWAFLPSPFLHRLGLHYYPNRWWALAVPAWLVVLVVYIYVALASYNTGYMTLPMGSIEGVVDEAAQIAGVEGGVVRREKRKGRERKEVGSQRIWPVWREEEVDWVGLWNEGTDAVLDVPIGGIGQ